MAPKPQSAYVSRGGDKLAYALRELNVPVEGRVCADLGSHVGGFVDCLLKHGACRVFSVDTAYGILAWVLRKDERVTVLERMNALHVELPQKVDLVTIDVGWTPQEKVLANVEGLLAPGGAVVSLIKPHYEAEPSMLEKGVLPDEKIPAVVSDVLATIKKTGWTCLGQVDSPIRGHGGNREVLVHLIHSTNDNAEGVEES